MPIIINYMFTSIWIDEIYKHCKLETNTSFLSGPYTNNKNVKLLFSYEQIVINLFIYCNEDWKENEKTIAWSC